MDVPTANQSQTPCQPRAGQNGWSPASAQGPLCNPLPGFQHLSLGSPSDLRPCYNHLQASNQGFHCDITAVSSRNDSHHCTLHPNNNADQTVQQIILDPHVSSMVAAASQGRNIPPCSHPLLNKGKTHQIPFNSTHGLYQAISSPFQHSYTHQGSLNGPQSPHEEHLPIGSPSYGQCVNQNPLCSPRPALESSVEYMHSLASPTSPIQHQPPWILPPHSIGRFICNMYMTCLHACCRAAHGSGSL